MRALVLLFWAIASAALGQDFTTLKGHGGPVMGLAISPSGQVASASFDNSVGLWSDRTAHWLEGHDAAVIALAFLDDATLVSGGDDFALYIWHAGQGRELGRHKGKISAVAVSPDGGTIATASWDGSIGLWPLDGGAPRFLDQHGAGVNDVAFAPGGARLYAATSGGDVIGYDLASGDMRRIVRHGFAVNKLALGPDETWLAYGSVDGVTRVIDPQTGAALHDFTLERRPILAMRHHQATGQLAVGDGQGYIMLIDTGDWRITRDFRATREGPVWALVFTPDGETIFAGGLDDVVYGWPVALMDRFEPAMDGRQSFLRPAASMPNGERQFMRKCSICHALTDTRSRKAGPSLAGLFGRRAGTLPGYRYSDTLDGSDIVWTAETIDALFDLGPDHYIPGSKMPMQRITAARDRQDLIDFLAGATR